MVDIIVRCIMNFFRVSLKEQSITEFHKQLLSAFNEVIQTKEWLVIEELLDDWKATVEVGGNPKLAEVLLAEEKPSEYVRF